MLVSARQFLRSVFASTYPEVTPAAVLVGVLIGVLMTASFSYAALVLGFSTNGSTVAAILGWGTLKLLLKRGTIVESNIVQTIASGINTTTAGVIFTVPVLLIRGSPFSVWWVGVACVAGAIMGVGFIIPLRKQMIDIDRLRFPSGTAVASILKAPSEGARKSRLLVAGAAVSGFVYVLTQLPKLGLPFGLPATVDVSHALGLPPYVENVWAVSLLGAGIGFIAGRNGLFVLAGGVLAYWVLTPLVVNLGWVPHEVSTHNVAAYVHNHMTRPLGIGMLVGGSLMGVVLALPAISAAFRNMRQALMRRDDLDELPLNVLYAVLLAAFAVLFLAAFFSSDIPAWRALLVALVGTVWLWFAGIIVSQATGMTDWTPISGMALLAVVFLLLVLPKDELATAVLIGATVSVAIAECADMMQDLKTGHLVGSRPFRQQTAQLLVAWIGPVVAISVMLLIWHAGGVNPSTGERLPGFGPGTSIEAPQATALGATIDSVIGGDVPKDKFVAGGILGMLLSFSGIPGLGVIMGISMYLSLKYILPYGVGSIVAVWARRRKGVGWYENVGIPVAAGLVVGEALLTIVFAVIKMTGAVAP